MVQKSMWTCPECGTRSLLVTAHQHCPACGAEQRLDACYVPSDAEQRMAKNHPFVGRELACLACQTLNSRESNYCGGCGCSLAGAREVPPSASRSRLSRSDMSRSDLSRSAASRSAASLSRSAALSSAGMSGAGMSSASLSSASLSRTALRRKDLRPTESGRARLADEQSVGLARLNRVSQEVAEDQARRSKQRAIILLVAIATMAAVYFLTMRGSSDDARVTGHGWSRVIEIEQFRDFVENGRCDSIPFGAKLISERGNNQCSYRHSEWQVVREAESSGEGFDSPREWPELRLRWTGSGDCEGCEREGQRIELYLLKVEHRGRHYSCEVTSAIWESSPIDTRLLGRVDPQTGSLDCASLTPK